MRILLILTFFLFLWLFSYNATYANSLDIYSIDLTKMNEQPLMSSKNFTPSFNSQIRRISCDLTPFIGSEKSFLPGQMNMDSNFLTLTKKNYDKKSKFIPDSIGHNIRLANKKSHGRKIIIRGQILDSKCRPIPNAVISIWQKDALGYDIENIDAMNLINSDKNFEYTSKMITNEEGKFIFLTVIPGDDIVPHINFHIKSEKYNNIISKLFFYKLSEKHRKSLQYLKNYNPNQLDKLTLQEVRESIFEITLVTDKL